MKHRSLNNRAGMTLLEVMISTGLLTIVLVGTLTLLTTMMQLWAKGVSGTSANSISSLAARKLVLEIEEGNSASIDNGRLTVVFPYLNPSTGDYDRAQAGITATYYLSGETGNESTGANLWKSVGVSKTRLAKSIESLSFTIQNGKLVRFTLTGVDQEGAAISPKTEQVSVKLRNS